MLRMDGEGSLARLVEKRIVRLLKTSLVGEIAVGRLRDMYESVYGALPLEELGFVCLEELVLRMPISACCSHKSDGVLYVRRPNVGQQRRLELVREERNKLCLPSPSTMPVWSNPRHDNQFYREATEPASALSGADKFAAAIGHKWKGQKVKFDLPVKRAGSRAVHPSQFTGKELLYHHPVDIVGPSNRLFASLPLAVARPEPQPSKLDQVKKIVEDRQLGPITVQVFTPKGGAMFGVIKMDGQTFSGYHERSTCQNSEEAQELVAAVALEYLEREKSSGLPVNEDVIVFGKRLMEIVAGVQTGFLCSYVTQEYEKRYQELLPADWIERLSKATDQVFFEEIGGRKAVFPAKKRSFQPVEAAPPTKMIWKVHVLIVLAADQVGVRIMDCDAYDEWVQMMSDMAEHYGSISPDLKLVPELQEGNMYVVCCDAVWMRVSLLQFLDGDKVMVKLIDFADVETVDIADLYEVDPKFTKLACQSLVCSLYGVRRYLREDPLAANSVVEMLVQRTVDRELTAQFIDQDVDGIIVSLVDEHGADINNAVLSRHYGRHALAEAFECSDAVILVSPDDPLFSSAQPKSIQSPPSPKAAASPLQSASSPKAAASPLQSTPPPKTAISSILSTPPPKMAGSLIQSPELPNLADMSIQSPASSPSKWPSGGDVVVAAFDFPEGDFPIVMTHVTGPTSFHFRAAASDRSYTSMMNGMKEFYAQPGFGCLGSADVKLNGYYVALHPDTDDYHRVQVKHRIGKDEFLVHLIDVGGCGVRVFKSALCTMDRKFASKPALAAKGTLAGLGEDFDETREHRELFKQVIEAQDLVAAFVRFHGEVGGKPTVAEVLVLVGPSGVNATDEVLEIAPEF